jgi:hypothetical protein
VKILWALLSFVALFFASAVSAQTPPPITPEGWTEIVEKGTRLYRAPASAAFVMVKTGLMPDKNDIDFRDVVDGMYADDGMLGKCGDPKYIRKNYLFDDKATELVIRENGLECSAIAGQYAGKGYMVYAMGRENDGHDAPQKAREILGRLMGLTQSGKPTQYDVQIPTGPMARKPSVSSTGTYGVWVALKDQTNYDPQAMMWRNELGVYYMVLTKGGYFMFTLPDNGGFTDEAAIAMMKESPKMAGRYSLVGNILTLRYGDGTVEKARADQGSYELDNESYNPKRYFADGTALSGPYSSSSITPTYAGFVVGERDFDFTADGRFGYGRAVSMSTAAYSSTGGREGRGGRYYIKDSAIHLAFDDGDRAVWPIWQEDQNGPIWFNGEMYKPAGK